MACGCGKKNKTIITTAGEAESIMVASSVEKQDRYFVETASGETQGFDSYIAAAAFRRTNGGKIRAAV